VSLQRVVVRWQGGAPDRAAVAEALPLAERALAVVESLMDGRLPVRRGHQLADCYLAPILDYFARTEDGRAVLARRPRLSTWWARNGADAPASRDTPELG
jgi:glutathione S-transferase